MKRKWKTLFVTFLLVLCMTAGTLVTYALLSSVTQTATNVFASSRNIGITLTEPQWEDHGKSDAAAYVPGQKIDKDPTVTLNEDSVSSYVALKVQYYDQNDREISFKAFEGKYLDSNDRTGIDFSDSWKFIGSTDGSGADETGTDGKSVVYMYEDALTQDNAETQAKEDVTVPLFTKVHISLGIEADQETKLLPRFQIKVTAYAVQSDGMTSKEAEAALYDMVTKTK